jgi:hypothetical protein
MTVGMNGDYLPEKISQFIFMMAAEPVLCEIHPEILNKI